jgi:excinuclease ABC subunit C
MRGGKVLDRREFFWEDLGELEANGALDVGEFFSTLLTQLYLDQHYVPREIYIPVDFEDRPALEDLLAEKSGHRVHIVVPQRGDKRSLVDLVGSNAKQSYDQRFRVMKPRTDVLKSVLQDVFMLPEPPKRIECFDISHIQGAETVASMVVWEDGKMKNSEYRKFKIKGVIGVDDFASMREVVGRRYKRIQEDKLPMPSLILIDGGIGQLHSAAEALESLGIINQPLASIAKREEILYLLGQENEPIVLERHNPALHLIQQIRDEAHRFAVTYHRKRREIRDRHSDLLDIPGIGDLTRRRLLQHFGSLDSIRKADATALTAVVNSKQAQAIYEHFHPQEQAAGLE